MSDRFVTLKFAGLLLITVLPGEALAAEDSAVLSPRIANYAIEVRLDPSAKILEGKEVVTWRNDKEVPATELRFHLYWNAWKNNRSTWLRENSLRTSSSRATRATIREGDWAWCEVESIKVVSGGTLPGEDLTPAMRHASPDDNNPEDQTVLVVPLSRAVLPRESISVEIQWKSKIPRTFARTGFRGDFFFIVHWFPKLGVYQSDGTWNCHQFHAATEFFSDFGVYDVRMTVPRQWRLGATGRVVDEVENPDGTRTHRYRQEDVHDFAWTASPDYREERRRFEEPGLRTVDMRLLYQPEHAGQVDRHFRATEAALKHYGTWYGEYPYDHVTIVDPAYGSGAGGMEYPTLFTCGTRYLNPFGGGSPEGVTVHEAGHQFWYGVVANNEFEHAWLDEGLNTFSTDRVMEVVFGRSSYVQRFFRGFFPVMVREIVTERAAGGARLDGYRAAARYDVQAHATYKYHPEKASFITYNKTALWLLTLEKTIGWDALQRVLSTFFVRWRFRHPVPEDFFAVANEVSGRDLTDFFDEVHRKAVVFDYSVESVSSRKIEVEGFTDREGKPVYVKGEQSGGGQYETTVVLRRLQDGILPVDVLFRFEDGEEARDVWDGRDLWKLYTFVKPAMLEYAFVDPERKLVLDVNYTNNSMLRESRAGFSASKWALKWMVWLQDYLQTLSFLY